MYIYVLICLTVVEHLSPDLFTYTMVVRIMSDGHQSAWVNHKP